MLVALKRLHPGDIYITQIKWLFPAVHPLAERHTRAASRLDTYRIKAGRNPDIVHLGRQSQMIGIVGGKTFRSIEKRMDAGFAQHWHPVDRHFKDRFKVVEILGQLVKLKVLGNAVHGPGL